ncbi:hypothetical protein KBC79_02355 [Candidatus Woesebacteria bacterium]|nr:hypothetical protein [Candidatus Woesebacteria bacterium]
MKEKTLEVQHDPDHVRHLLDQILGANFMPPSDPVAAHLAAVDKLYRVYAENGHFALRPMFRFTGSSEEIKFRQKDLVRREKAALYEEIRKRYPMPSKL